LIIQGLGFIGYTVEGIEVQVKGLSFLRFGLWGSGFSSSRFKVYGLGDLGRRDAVAMQ
jgi:hypothetical protein